MRFLSRPVAAGLLALALPAYAALQLQAPPAPRRLLFRPCRLVEDWGTKSTEIDSASKAPDAVYALTPHGILSIAKCGSIYLFSRGKTASTFYPTRYENTCYGTLELTRSTLEATGGKYFVLINHDTYLGPQSIKLVLADLPAGKARVVDSGQIDSTLTYDKAARTLHYRKAGASRTYVLK